MTAKRNRDCRSLAKERDNRIFIHYPQTQGAGAVGSGVEPALNTITCPASLISGTCANASATDTPLPSGLLLLACMAESRRANDIPSCETQTEWGSRPLENDNATIAVADSFCKIVSSPPKPHRRSNCIRDRMKVNNGSIQLTRMLSAWS